MERIFELKTDKFSGPLEKLLELIEAEEMPVSEVSMAKVTDSFLKYLDELRGGNSETGGYSDGDERADDETGGLAADIRIVADFVSIASRLIFLKSKNLLPGLPLTEEEEADIKDLEDRLRLYQSLKPAMGYLRNLWRANHRSYSRSYLLGKNSAAMAAASGGKRMFFPGSNSNIEDLKSALSGIFETVTAYTFETETIKEKIVTLEEKISEVLSRIGEEGLLRFNKLSGEKTRSEMVVLFLAVLHLAREQLIILEQMENFSDIMLKKNNPDNSENHA